MTKVETVALFRLFPSLRAQIPWSVLGEWPTPVQPLTAAALQSDYARDGAETGEVGGVGDIWVKREDLSSPVYGGNKIRTLEAHCGLAVAQGKARIWSTGAFGSNHATATLMHANRAGLAGGAMLFTQPGTCTAQANLRAMAASGEAVVALWSVASLPFAIISKRRAGDYVMTPGGATPTGSFGHISAALELAIQVDAGELPAPRSIYLPAGSTCTSAGLLVGLHVSAALGIGFGDGKAPLPTLRPVRVTPWPVTSKTAILALARWTSRRFQAVVDRPMDLSWRRLASTLDVIGGQLGRGYGYPTPDGKKAIAAFAAANGPKLDVVYSGKAAAGMLAAQRRLGLGPALFWATKSTAPLPQPDAAALKALPPGMQRWLEKAPEQV